MNGDNNGKEQRKQEWEFRIFIGLLIIAVIVLLRLGWYMMVSRPAVSFNLSGKFILIMLLSALATFITIIIIRFIISMMKKGDKSKGEGSQSSVWQKVKSKSSSSWGVVLVIIGLVWLGMFVYKAYKSQASQDAHGVIYRKPYTFVRTKPPGEKGVADTPETETLEATVLYYAPNTRLEFVVHYKDYGKPYQSEWNWDIYRSEYGSYSQPSPESSGKFYLKEEKPGVFSGLKYYEDGGRERVAMIKLVPN